MISKRAAGVLILCLIALSLVPNGAFAANDPLFGQQWALHRIQGEPAWGPAAAGSGVIVAVVDTGVDFGHPDLAGRSAGQLNAIRGADTACESASGDNNGHGTQVAGIIAANANNGQGVASVAPAAMILSVKALDCNGDGYLSDVSNGIRLAADHGARVINLSLGYEIGLLGALVNNLFGEDEVSAFQAAIDYAAGKGAAVVAAAGNDALQSSYAGMENVLVVGASGANDEHSWYSSSGAEIMAPGGNSTAGCTANRCLLTTERGGGYAAVQGTSFAAPHVSGVAALLFRQGHSAPGVRSVILTTADPVAAGRRVHAARAVGAPVIPTTEEGGAKAAGQQTGNGGGATPSASGGGRPAGTPVGKGASKNAAADPRSPPGDGAPGSPTPTQTAATLVLGAPPNERPEVSPSVAGDAERSSTGGRVGRLLGSRRDDAGTGPGGALIAIGITAALAGGIALWKKRRLI